MGQLSVNLAVKVKELHRSLKKEERTGVSFPRFFTAKLEEGATPYDQIAWESLWTSLYKAVHSSIISYGDRRFRGI